MTTTNLDDLSLTILTSVEKYVNEISREVQHGWQQ